MWGRMQFVKLILFRLVAFGAGVQVLCWAAGREDECTAIVKQYQHLIWPGIVFWAFFNYIFYDAERENHKAKYKKRLIGASRRKPRKKD